MMYLVAGFACSSRSYSEGGFSERIYLLFTKYYVGLQVVMVASDPFASLRPLEEFLRFVGFNLRTLFSEAVFRQPPPHT